MQNQPQGSAIVPCRAEVALCLETKLRRLFASFSPAGGAARPLRQPRSIDRQRALSPADSVATRCIYGQVVTTMRNGGLYEGRGTEEHGRGRCQRKVLTTIRDRDPPGRRIEFPQRCQCAASFIVPDPLIFGGGPSTYSQPGPIEWLAV